MTAWFKRKKQGIYTETKDKKDLPHGLWHKCTNCAHLILSEDFEKLFFVCNECNHHENINSSEYFKILFDNNNYKELFANIKSEPKKVIKEFRIDPENTLEIVESLFSAVSCV